MIESFRSILGLPETPPVSTSLIHEVFGTGSFLTMAETNAVGHVSKFQWFAGQSKCHVFSNKTEFLSVCTIIGVEGLIAAFLLLPLLLEASRLSLQHRGKCTYLGRTSALFATLYVFARLTQFFVADTSPAPAEWVLLAASAAAAWLHTAQEGRVLVSSTEILVFWLTISATTIFHAVDAYLRGSPLLWYSISSVFACMAFGTELFTDRCEGELSYDSINVFQKVTLNFVTPIFEKGCKEKLERSDFPKTPRGITAVSSYGQLEAALQEYHPEARFRLLRALFRITRGDVIAMVFCEVMAELFTYSRPLALSKFLLSLQSYHFNGGHIFPSIYWALIVGTVPTIATAFYNIVTLYDSNIYSLTRVSLMGIIYRKALQLSPKSREEFDAAKIMNLINVDADSIDSVAGFIPTFFGAPLAIGMSTWQLWEFMGKSMFAAIPLYLLFVPFSSYVSTVMYTMFPKIMKIRDARNKTTSNTFRNIKSLKLYAWENPFSDKVRDIRAEELAILRRNKTLFSTMSAIWSMMSDFVAFAVFVAFLYFRQGTLRPDTVFATLSLLSLVTIPFMSLPAAVTGWGKAVASSDRINKLLLEGDFSNPNRVQKEAVENFEDSTIQLENVAVSWNGDIAEDKIALRNLNFQATNGELVCITGKVGSGKSALLKAICGDVIILQGTITVSGDIAYCAQEAWLQNKSVKENILFGRRYDEAFYNKVVAACDLTKDLAQLPDKDETEVGERGISLSGGQKARVSLARAIYSRADIYVLDDVLSAVDEHVSTHLIREVFSKDGLLAQKTVVLATNNVKVLSHASVIVALQNKEIIESGSVQEVLSKADESAIYRLIKEFGVGGDIDKIKIEDRRAFVAKAVSEHKVVRHRRASFDGKPSLQKSDEEEKGSEAVSVAIYKRYFAAAGNRNFVMSIVIMVLSVMILSTVNVWLGILSNHRFTNLPDAKFYVLVYLAIAVSASISIFVSSYFSMCYLAVRVSKVLHDEMLENLIRAPMSLFDSMPLGKIINRFTGDLENLDNTLPMYLYYFIRSCMNVVYNAVLIIAGAPAIVILVIILGLFSNNYRKKYVPASRQISRMASAANSPILSHIEESIKGVSIVRAFSNVDHFIETYDYRADYWIECNFLRRNCRRWLQWRVQSMTALLGLCTAFAMCYVIYRDTLSVGFVGVVMHSTTRIGVMTQQAIYGWADLEVAGVALERILEFIDTEKEAAAHIPETAPDAEWPIDGSIQYDNYSTRYKTSKEDVLKELTFSINNKEKIGIVGRTGSGKSTLTLTLFRLIEASGGVTRVDGVDTAKIGLTDLRSKLSIIPQDAQIFEGTLRENLDPLGTVDDARLWKVLELCSLKEHFIKISTGLDTPLVDGGDNLSRGQAQLICLGRALVHEAKILVLDEATASVDVETDAVVQKTIREQFKDRTIITIAHRLNTIMDSDRIMVLDKGRLVEFDTPARLLESKSYFWSLNNADKQEEET